MIFRRDRSRWRVQCKFIAASLGVVMMSFQYPVLAQTKDNSTLIAQTSVLGPVTALGTRSAPRKRKRSIITDSLWGNLILEFAYDKDPVLHELGTGIKLMNFATSFGLTGIAGGTLYQGIYAISALNPPPGHQDSYVPGITGITLAGCTLVTILSRQIVGHELFGHVRKRQFELKGKVEALLTRLEDSHCTDAAATSELVALIGEQPAGEWLQMWRATHKLSTEAHRIGMETPAGPSLMAAAGNSEGGM